MNYALFLKILISKLNFQ